MKWLSRNARRLGAAVAAVGLLPIPLSAVAQEATQEQAASTGEAVPKADPALAEARARRTNDEAVSNFLNRKKQRQQRRERALGERGNATDAQELRRLYRALNIPKPSPKAQISSANETALGESFETDAVQLLQSLNFRPARIKKLADAGFNPLQAAAGYIRGTSTIVDQGLLSDIVAVVRVTAVRNEQLGDGFRSTVLLEIVDPIAGRSPNKPIALRQLSGQDTDGSTIEVSTDLKPSDGQTYVVMLSNGLYEQLARESGGQPAGKAAGATRNYVLLGSSYQVQGDSLVATDGGATSTTSLSQLKTTLAPLARAKTTVDASEPETAQ